MYRAVRETYMNKTVNYLDLVKWLESKHNLIFTYKFAYGKQIPERAQSFITLMRTNGFDVNISDIFWNTEIGVRCAVIMPNVDALVLCSGYYEHGAVLKYAKEQGKITYVVCPNIPNFFKNYATILDFPKEILRERKNDPIITTEPVELPANKLSDAP